MALTERFPDPAFEEAAAFFDFEEDLADEAERLRLAFEDEAFPCVCFFVAEFFFDDVVCFLAALEAPGRTVAARRKQTARTAILCKRQLSK